MSRALPSGTMLLGEYEIISVLGEGGFAITYKGKNGDGNTVAIKEYFPSSFSVRENIRVFSETKEQFESGKRRFIKEAEVLREFQHLDGIVAVYDCFEENGTAYIVMEYIEGITLKEYVTEQGVVPYEELMELISSMIRALAQIHRHGVIHRDISPDNVMIGLDNKARLIDFGAVGILNEDGNYGKTVILKTGYAPAEQYLEDGKMGAWTDVYGLAATLYMSLTGTSPMNVLARLQRDETETRREMYHALTSQAHILPWQAEAILTGMALAVDERYSNMGEFYEALTVEPSMEHDATVMGHMVPGEDEKLVRARIRKNQQAKLPLILAGVSLTLVLLLSVIVGKLMVDQNGQYGRVDSETQTDESKKDTFVGSDTKEKVSATKRTEKNTTLQDDGKKITKQYAEDEGLANTKSTSGVQVSTKATTQKQPTTKPQKKKTDKATTEAVKIHEDGVEHLNIEE